MEGKAERKEYRVLVTETRQKTVLVEAGSEAQARRRAQDAWQNAEYLIGEECFQGIEFHVLGGMDGTGGEKSAERLDVKDG